MIKLRKTAAIMLAAALAICVGAHADSGGFSDVPASAWYNDAVGWAVEEGVAEGTGDGIFSPDAGCTCAQIVTFIWRMAGSPEPSETSDAFHDLPEDAYYYDAMLWANEKGIISGTSEVTLSPDGPCTRAQAVTMLWRYAGADDGYTGYFTDVPETAYYYQAVGWAINRYVADGTTLLEFGPDLPCTRAQIVTMLYRMQRTGSEALSGEVESVRIENTITEEELNLDAGEIAEFASIFSRAALNDNSVPQMGEEQTSNPMYVVYVGYAGGGEDVFYGTEAGATVIYKRTGTYGPGGPGFIAVRNAEMQSFFDRLGI